MQRQGSPVKPSKGNPNGRKPAHTKRDRRKQQIQPLAPTPALLHQPLADLLLQQQPLSELLFQPQPMASLLLQAQPLALQPQPLALQPQRGHRLSR